MAEYGWIIVIALIVIAALTVIYIIRKIRSKIRSISFAAFGVNSLAKGLELQSQRLAATPKSVAGMTKIYLPQIQRDFPQFNLYEFTSKTEKALTAALLAISAQDVSLLRDSSLSLLEQIRHTIADHKKQGIAEKYERIKIHRTEITSYIKQQGTCKIALQSAVEYLRYTAAGSGTVTSGSMDRLEQTKYNVEFVYIQDAEKARALGNSVGIQCPNCGAPVRQLGHKHCEYCGSAVTEINLHVWSINNYYEVKN